VDRVTVSLLIPRRVLHRHSSTVTPSTRVALGLNNGVHWMRPPSRGEQRIAPGPQEQLAVAARRDSGWGDHQERISHPASSQGRPDHERREACRAAFRVIIAGR
jgi:hypothetical protein